MIKNIKIHNILNIIEISKSMEPNKCIQKKLCENVHLSVFPMICQSSMGPRKSRCHIPSVTTKGHDCLHFVYWIWNFLICGEFCFQVGRIVRFISFQHC
jgi:hypothetical protein